MDIVREGDSDLDFAFAYQADPYLVYLEALWKKTKDGRATTARPNVMEGTVVWDVDMVDARGDDEAKPPASWLNGDVYRLPIFAGKVAPYHAGAQSLAMEPCGYLEMNKAQIEVGQSRTEFVQYRMRIRDDYGQSPLFPPAAGVWFDDGDVYRQYYTILRPVTDPVSIQLSARVKAFVDALGRMRDDAISITEVVGRMRMDVVDQGVEGSQFRDY